MRWRKEAEWAIVDIVERLTSIQDAASYISWLVEERRSAHRLDLPNIPPGRLLSQ